MNFTLLKFNRECLKRKHMIPTANNSPQSSNRTIEISRLGANLLLANIKFDT